MKNSGNFKNKKADVIKFIIVMILFTIGMVVMILKGITTWWIWYIYVLVWTFAEWEIAKNMHLKWWHWVLILIALSSLDVLIIGLTS